MLACLPTTGEHMLRGKGTILYRHVSILLCKLSFIFSSPYIQDILSECCWTDRLCQMLYDFLTPTWWAHMSIAVLSLKEVLVAHWTHAIIPGVPIETTAGGTEQRSLAPVGLLGHVPPVWREGWKCAGQYHVCITRSVKRQFMKCRDQGFRLMHMYTELHLELRITFFSEFHSQYSKWQK